MFHFLFNVKHFVFNVYYFYAIFKMLYSMLYFSIFDVAKFFLRCLNFSFNVATIHSILRGSRFSCEHGTMGSDWFLLIANSRGTLYFQGGWGGNRNYRSIDPYPTNEKSAICKRVLVVDMGGRQHVLLLLNSLLT
jgi:hypothetical protein